MFLLRNRFFVWRTSSILLLSLIFFLKRLEQHWYYFLCIFFFFWLASCLTNYWHWVVYDFLTYNVLMLRGFFCLLFLEVPINCLMFSTVVYLIFYYFLPILVVLFLVTFDFIILWVNKSFLWESFVQLRTLSYFKSYNQSVIKLICVSYKVHQLFTKLWSNWIYSLKLVF